MLTFEKWVPPRPDVDTLERRMRRLIQDLGFAPALTPAADLYETEQEIILELEVPGFDEKELSVAVTDHVLTVSGSRIAEHEKPARTPRFHERLESTFQRRFQLPPEADTDHVTADYGKGVLTLHVPKLGATKQKLIKIGKS